MWATSRTASRCQLWGLMGKEKELDRFKRWYKREKFRTHVLRLPPSTSVRGLKLPRQLVKLMRSNPPRWTTPSHSHLLAVVPWLHERVSFLESPQQIGWESTTLIDCPGPYEYLGSKAEAEKPLPWLDSEQALIIAIAHEIGGGQLVALDYRPDPGGPQVVATDHTQIAAPSWRLVAETFSSFVEMCEL